MIAVYGFNNPALLAFKTCYARPVQNEDGGFIMLTGVSASLFWDAPG